MEPAVPAQVPLRDVILGGEIGPEYYSRARYEFFVRADGEEELETFLPEAGADPVREATIRDFVGQRDQALQVLSTHAENPWAIHLRGHLLLEEGRSQEARAILEDAWKKHSGVPQIGALLVEARVLSGELDSAEELFKSLSFGPDDARGKYLAGLISEFSGDYSEALASYENAAEASPDDTRIHFRLGYLHSLHGDEDRAIEAYEMCQRTTPVYTRALINLGVLYEDQEKFDEAVTCYRMVLQSNPHHPRARLFLEDAEASQNMYYDREKEKEKNRRNQILQIPVTDFELSVRSRNCLAKMNIHTLGDLIKKTEAELLSYKNFGETSLSEIKKILAQKGFRLGQGLEDKPGPQALPDSEQTKILGEPVSVLDLSSRAQRCMDRLGIESLADLVKRTELELISQKNFGMTSLNEVKMKLKERGLSLASG